MVYVCVKKDTQDLCVNIKHVLITVMEMEYVIMVNVYANLDLKDYHVMQLQQLLNK
jgi:hypothetical protein